jgi:hypothetical protein
MSILLLVKTKAGMILVAYFYIQGVEKLLKLDKDIKGLEAVNMAKLYAEKLINIWRQE